MNAPLHEMNLFNKPGLEIRHFDKNSNSRKCKTQGKTQNSRRKNPELKEKTQGFCKFYSNHVENNKINVNLSLCVLNFMLSKNGLFLKVQFCRRFSQKLMKNSHRKLKVTKKSLKTQAKNSKGRQIHLFYLPTLGRIS